MPIPDFVAGLRGHVGTDLLWLIGVSAAVFDDHGRVLLTRRRDTGRWAMVGGIVEPGQDPAPAVVREIVEETGVTATVERLVSVLADPPFAYPNGDQVQFLTFSFACRAVAGDARVADDENLEVGWYHPTNLPDLSALQRERLRRALRPPELPYLRPA